MQSSIADRDFAGYNAAQVGRPVRDLAVRAVESAVDAQTYSAADVRPVAVELGCGIGIEARYLAEQGYEVRTYDADPTVEPQLRELAEHVPVQHTTTPLEAIECLPAAELVLSCATLSFVPRTGFGGLWRAICAALRPGGVLAVDLFGANDDWAGIDGTFVTRAELDSLLEGWSSIQIKESEYDGRSFSGPKHWHTFTVLARR